MRPFSYLLSPSPTYLGKVRTIRGDAIWLLTASAEAALRREDAENPELLRKIRQPAMSPEALSR